MSKRRVIAGFKPLSRVSRCWQKRVNSDREGDINELFQQVPNERTHLLIRSCQDRLLACKPPGASKWYARLAQQPEGGHFSLAIKGDPRAKRQATIVLRWAKV